MSNITLFQVENGLSYPLSFTNIETPTDGINPLNPGVTPTPGSGGTGCLIPDCTGQQWWNTNRMMIYGRDLVLNLWKENNTAYYYLGNTTIYPATAKISLGAYDGNAQQLTISGSATGGFEISMGYLPNQAIPSSSWMTQNYEALASRTFRQIAMPGSHDAGISAITAGNNGGGACNSQTQSGNVLSQLNAGARYIDLRPTIWNSSYPGIYLGHFSKPMSAAWVGVIGQTLAGALQNVIDFFAQPGCDNEVVILKFSHCYDIDGTNFSNSQYQQLVTQVQGALANVLYKQPSGVTGTNWLNNVPFKTIAGGSQRAVAVFEGLPSDLYSPTDGIFQYANCSVSGDLTVYDHDSETNIYTTMMTKQISQFNQFDQASGCLFLLSWTLPWQLPEAYCIDDMARPANIQLQTVIEQLVEQGTISAQKFPNILYCDYMEAQYNIVDICMYLNTLTT